MAKDDTWHVGHSVFGSHSIRISERTVRTSVMHPLQIGTIRLTEKGGRIGITFCPGKKGPSVFGVPWDRDLTVDVQAIRSWGASSVLTLIEPHEFDVLSVRGLPEAVREAGMVWHHAPIPDVSIPGLRSKQYGERWASHLRTVTSGWGRKWFIAGVA